MPKSRAKSKLLRIRLPWRRRSVAVAAIAVGIVVTVFSFAAGYYYVSFSRLIDARLQGARARVLPRVFARPLELRRGQALSDTQLVDRLNDLGYAQRPQAETPGEFVIGDGVIAIMPRSTELRGRLVRVVFRTPQPVSAKRTPQRRADSVQRLEIAGKPAERVTLDRPLLTSLTTGEREKRRHVPLSAIPPHVIEAVLAIEDRRYYSHPGVDPIRVIGAVVSSITSNKRVSAVSTLTQQVVRNVLLPQFDGWTLEMARARNIQRKLLENFVALILNTRASKDEILEVYLNDMPLGQRGSFAIVGVGEAARLFFGKDIRNVTVAEAATIAGVLQSPSALSPFNNPERSRQRRNVVLQAMVDAGYLEQESADEASEAPLTVVARALEAEAPHFVDYVTRTLEEDYPGLTTTTDEPVDVYTTLDHHLQRLAQDAVREGLTRVDGLLKRRRLPKTAEAALLAIDPRTGEILAMVGGRSYNQSQFNRATAARRQPGSVFKPFVYLAAFEQGSAGGPVLTPASVVDDTPTSWEDNGEVWTPQNYEQEYDGPITLRRALAKSRNVAAVKVAERIGYDRVAGFWKKLGVGTAPKPFPSIALGVFEATPLEIATAYTIFPNGGTLRPLRHILRIERGERDATKRARGSSKVVAAPETTYLVTSMMRSVVNEGTGAGIRGAGFTLDAAGKTGTTNDLKDAWFVGFTPTLLTVVWVGFDDAGQPLGLSGSQAALPIWSHFMTRSMAGTKDMPFVAPEGVTSVDIDPQTGHLAVPGCPKPLREAFVAGTEPRDTCPLHRN